MKTRILLGLAAFGAGCGIAFAATNTELGNDAAGFLFNLADDPGEQRNLIATQPERQKEMAAVLERIKQAGAPQP